MTKILIVDDEKVNRILLSACLRDVADIAEASDGAAALSYCRDTPPDLVLLDLMMPHISGVNVTKRLRKMHIPVVIVTAANDLDMILKALRCGAVGFLPKPFEEAAVRATFFLALETVRRLKAVGLRGATGKIVHEAAGILERHSNYTSRAAAIQHMQKIAQSGNITVPEYARKIIAAAALLNGSTPDDDSDDISDEDLGF